MAEPTTLPVSKLPVQRNPPSMGSTIPTQPWKSSRTRRCGSRRSRGGRLPPAGAEDARFASGPCPKPAGTQFPPSRHAPAHPTCECSAPRPAWRAPCRCSSRAEAGAVIPDAAGSGFFRGASQRFRRRAPPRPVQFRSGGLQTDVKVLGKPQAVAGDPFGPRAASRTYRAGRRTCRTNAGNAQAGLLVAKDAANAGRVRWIGRDTPARPQCLRRVGQARQHGQDGPTRVRPGASIPRPPTWASFRFCASSSVRTIAPGGAGRLSIALRAVSRNPSSSAPPSTMSFANSAPALPIAFNSRRRCGPSKALLERRSSRSASMAKTPAPSAHSRNLRRQRSLAHAGDRHG